MPYIPGKLPALKDPDAIALAQYLEDELHSLASGLIENVTEVVLSPIFAAPKKPREGMVVYADGTLWNPGSGEGLYVYGSDNVWHFMDVAAKSLSVVNRLFTTSGTYTPTAGMVYCIVELVGPGGGGGGVTSVDTARMLGGGGGGGGGYSRKILSAATVGASQTVTVGTGGAGGAAGSHAGAAGSGNTSVGTLCIAGPGGGGQFCAASQYGDGGSAGAVGTGDITSAGELGWPGAFISATVSAIFPSGRGGKSFFGNGAPGVSNSGGSAPGIGGGLYGGGGSGGITGGVVATVGGGAGAAGVVFITEYVYA